MVGCAVLIHDLAGLVSEDLHTRESGFETVKDGPLMLLGRGSAVVSVHHGNVVGVRTYDGEFLDGALVQRKDAVVLEENHGLTGGLPCKRVVLLAADNVLSKVMPRIGVGRVEHSKLETSKECPAQVNVKVSLADETLLQGVAKGYESVTALQVSS